LWTTTVRDFCIQKHLKKPDIDICLEGEEKQKKRKQIKATNEVIVEVDSELFQNQLKLSLPIWGCN